MMPEPLGRGDDHPVVHGTPRDAIHDHLGARALSRKYYVFTRERARTALDNGTSPFGRCFLSYCAQLHHVALIRGVSFAVVACTLVLICVS